MISARSSSVERERKIKRKKTRTQSSTRTSIFVMYLLEYLRERGVVRGGSTRRHDDEVKMMSFFFCEELCQKLLFLFNFLFPLSLFLCFLIRDERLLLHFFLLMKRKRTRIINNVIRLRESSELLLF